MLVSLEWLKEYTDVSVSTEEFCNRMIMSGSNIETCEHMGTGISKVVVGKIEKIERHPDADKLVVCLINTGEDQPIQIVTGAGNVFEGAMVPVCLHGSHIPGPLHGQPKLEGGVKITKGKLRGVVSNGMLCSATELGFDDKVAPLASKDGIWILPEDLTPGVEITEALKLEDDVIDFEITPNRPDCLSMLGMAREAKATFGTDMKYPDIDCESRDGNAADYIQVEIKSDFCRRYTARIVKDVKIEQSPWWMQKRLIHAGMRPINNIVDITNYVMLEYGQPLHAFDIRSIKDAHIIVDVAKDGDKFTTLDGTERELKPGMLMINDAENPVAIAGVMGGLNSEILEDTNTIVIESANFAGDSVRTTSKKLTLRTEASGRFEKGIDPNLCEDAADRVCRLVEILGAGKVVGGSVDVYPTPVKAAPVKARVSRINNVLGIDVSREYMISVLESLEMKVAGSGDNMLVTPPTVRMDILEEVDVIEEIARMYGYDKMPVTIPKSGTEAVKPRTNILKGMTREALCGMGLSEIQTYSFVSPKGVDKINIDEDSWERAFVKIVNPLGDDTSVMRTVLTPNMLEVLGRNFSRSIEAAKAFEIGNTFIRDLVDSNGQPIESDSLCLGAYGEGEDFFTMKGVILELLDKLGIKGVEFVPEREYGVYHPGRCARLVVYKEMEPSADFNFLKESIMSEESSQFDDLKKKLNDAENKVMVQEIELGIMGEVHPDVAKNFGITTRCYCGELMYDVICELASTECSYSPLPKYPSTSRDIALIVDEDIPVGDMMKVIKAYGKDILEKVELFDVYRGEQVEEGKKSAAFTLTYRHRDKTLTDEDVSKVHVSVLDALKEGFEAVLRDI